MNTTISAGDTAWVLTSTALVMVMTVGLAFFYGGLVRPKNALNTMMMSVVALGVISVQWVLVGYSIAFAHGTPWWGGLSWAAFKGVGLDPDPAYAATIPLQAHAMFQAMFAIITPALISGAIVERMHFRAYVVFLVLWATFVYDPLAHWVWGAGGWLQKLGALDFAGGTVVHISAGVSALVAARMLGPRKDFKRVPIVPHNVPLVLLGAGLLWFGWFGFNAGSALAANGLAALAFTNTNTAAATALLTWVGLDLFRTRSEEHTSELQSQFHLVCRLLLEKKKQKTINHPQFPLPTQRFNPLIIFCYSNYYFTYIPFSSSLLSPFTVHCFSFFHHNHIIPTP